MQTFMYNYFPTVTNGVAMNIVSTPPSSPSSDGELARRHFVAFYLHHVLIDKGGSEIKIRTDSTNVLLPRDKALQTIEAFMETTIAKESVGIRGIKSFPESHDCLQCLVPRKEYISRVSTDLDLRASFINQHMT